MGCATGSPIFQGVGYPEKKPVYNSGCDGRGCGRLVLLFPLASQGLSLCDGSWKRRGSGWRGVDTREPADIPKLYLSHHRGCSSTAMSFVPHHGVQTACSTTQNTYDNMQRLELHVLNCSLHFMTFIYESPLLEYTSSSLNFVIFCTFLHYCAYATSF